MKYSINWLKKYVDLPSNKEELNRIIDQIAYQIVDVEERWLGSSEDQNTVIDVDNKIITNRPYAFGHRGLAREIAIMLSKQWRGGQYPSIPGVAGDSLPLKVEVLHPELCPRFTAILIKNIKVGPSPKWLLDELEAIGQRSINNVVDITNYIMFDTGQPVHAYDYDKVKDGHFIIRRAKQGEKAVTLDGVDRTLDSEMILITDPEKVIGIGGVMGCGNSEVDENTTNIVLEVASFDPINIRQTAKKLKHRTDAVTRFEKGQDPTNILNVQGQLISLILENCGGSVASNLVDINNLSYSKLRHEPLILDFDSQRVDKLLGFGISEEFIRKVLDGFGIRIVDERDSIWTLEIPTYRPDIKEASDLIEDIGRMYGYQNIPSIIPLNQLIVPKTNPKVQVKSKIRKALNGSGFDEVLSFSFISQKDIDLLYQIGFEKNNAVKIINPLSLEYEYLRNSIIPNLVKFVGHNLKYFDEFGGFEISRKFIKNPNQVLPYDQDKGESQRPLEIEVLSAVYYSKNNSENSLNALKSAINNLGFELRIKDLSISKNGDILINSQKAGFIKYLDSAYLAEYDIEQKIAIIEIEIEKLVSAYVETVEFKDFSRFQGSKLEYSILIDENLSIEELRKNIPEHDLIANKEVIEVYRNKNKFGDKKSVLIRFNLQRMDGNLTAMDVYNVGVFIEESLRNVSGLEIRGGGVTKPSENDKLANATMNSGNGNIVILPKAGIQGRDETVSADSWIHSQAAEDKQVLPNIQEDSVTGELPAVLPENNSLATFAEENELAKLTNGFIVVGKVISIKKHPNADRLVICKVDVGKAKPSGTLFENYLQIVTGAENMTSLADSFDPSTNLIVPVALPGATVKSHKTGQIMQIKISELRGEVSEGMLCSANELDLPNPGYEGILLLGGKYENKVGSVFEI
jgi:phenylalanyl-tRNA synthetase beta chain